MNSQAVPAIIASSVSGQPLIGTVVTQIIGFRSTSADTKRQILVSGTAHSRSVRVARPTVPSILRRESTLDGVLSRRTHWHQHSRSGQDLGLLAVELLGGDDASVAQVSE